MDSPIICEFAELIIDPAFNLTLSRVQSIIDFLFDSINVGLIKPLMLVEDSSHFFKNHFLMLIDHYRVLKVFLD